MKTLRTEGAKKNSRPTSRTKKWLSVIAMFAIVAIMGTTAFSSVDAANSAHKILFGTSSSVASLFNFAGTGTNTVEEAVMSMPEANNATATTNSLNVARQGHTATQLDGLKVLLVGGNDNATAEILDLSTNTSTPTTGNPAQARTNHTATKLSDGKVLIAGGTSNGAASNTTEIFDPASGTFSAGPSMGMARSGQTATVLADGKVLVAGGDVSSSAEIYDPASNSFGYTSANMNVARSGHSAALMKDGRVLIVGGKDASGAELESAEIFDGTSFSTTGNAMAHHRVKPLLRVLHDGKVQIIGGNNDESMEVYDPADGIFGAHAHAIPVEDEHAALLKSDILSAPTRAALIRRGSSDAQLDRSNHTITEISGSNKALVAGGANNSGALNTFAVFNSSNATVSTDKLDYQPGQTARISGTGWQASETVNIIIHEDPHTHTERKLTATADGNGNFTANYLVEEHDLNVKFILGAKGQTSGRTAQTTFTDARQFRATITPNSVYTSQNTTYTITIRNTNTSPHTTQLASVSILLPNGFSDPTIGTITAPLNKTWTTVNAGNVSGFNNGYNSSSRMIGFRAINSSSQLANEESATFEVITTAPATANAYEWTTTAYANLNLDGSTFTIQTTPGQPTVTVNNLPTITSISPSSKTAGDSGFKITVNGTNFVSGSVVRFDGANRTTTFVSNTQLTASILTSDLTTAGSFPIRVSNPGSGGNSNTQTFTVNSANAAPSINRTNATVTVNEGTQATNTGTWSDADAGNTVMLSASVGTVIKGGTNASGTWSWSYTPTDGPAQSQTVTITANDGTTTSQTTFNLTVNNVAPTMTFNAPSTVDSENGGTFSIMTSSYSDSSSVDSAAGFDIAFTCDGTNYGSYTHVPANGNLGSSCSKATARTRTVGAKIKDKDGGETVYTKEVIIRAQTSLTLVSGSATYGDNTATLTAKLVSGSTNLSGKTVAFTFNGDSIGTETTDSNGVATKTVNLSGTNAGNYANAVGASFAGDTNYVESNGTGALTVNKATTTTVVTCPANVTFTGAALEPCTATVTSAGGLSQSVTIVYNNNTNAGTATATATYAESTNHLQSSNTKNFTIDPASSTTVVTCPATVTYNGAAQTPCSVSVTGAGGLNLTPSAVYSSNTNAGTATASYTYAGGGNYTGSNDSKNFTINKAQVTATAGGGSATYDGSTKSPSACEVTGVYKGDLACSNSVRSVGPGAGTTSIEPVVSGTGLANFDIKRVNGAYTIERAPTTTTITCPTNAAFTGAAVEPCTAKVTGANGLNETVAVSYTNNVNAGTATANAIYAESANYLTSSDSENFTIDKAATTTTVTCPATVTFTGAVLTPCSATVTGAGGLNESVAIVYNNNVNTGTATATATYAESTNYLQSSNSKNFTIDKASSTTVVTCPATVTYNGAAQTPCSAKVTGAGGLDQPLIVTYLKNANVGTATASASYAGDTNHTGSSDGKTFTILQAGTAISVSVIPTSVQYSDTVTFNASVVAANPSLNSQLSGTVQFFITSTAPNSPGVQIRDSITVNFGNSGGTVSLPFNNQFAPGGYNVSATFISSNANFSGSNSGNDALSIAKENARATYTGLEFVTTLTDSASVQLTATVQDITAVPTIMVNGSPVPNPAYDPNAGDIRNARVSFVNRDNNVVLCSNLTPNLVNASDAKTGTVGCNVNLSTGNTDSTQYTIGIVVNNYYDSNSSTENATVTVSKQVSSMITGGGNLVNESSAGQYAGGVGLKTNFGFNVKYNRQLTNLQGNVNVIIRTDDGKVYQIKSNSMTSMQNNVSTGVSTFESKANLTDITDPNAPVSLGGNLNFQMVLKDNGEPGTNDTIGITLRKSDGALLFSSNWNGVKTIEQKLSGGNIVVR